MLSCWSTAIAARNVCWAVASGTGGYRLMAHTTMGPLVPRANERLTMTTAKRMLGLVCLMAGTLIAQEPSHAAHVERSDGHSRQGRSDDHGGICARRVGPYPSTQCLCVCLRAGRLRHDASEGREGNHPDTRGEFL